MALRCEPRGGLLCLWVSWRCSADEGTGSRLTCRGPGEVTCQLLPWLADVDYPDASNCNGWKIIGASQWVIDMKMVYLACALPIYWDEKAGGEKPSWHRTAGLAPRAALMQEAI